ncbi:MAG: hypothetical protein M3Y74_16690 [Chloroflexota bacterium]|jgi:hypothetical protein|nr:hypothetical protein [Chloroflexota bacterium]
MIQQDGQEGQWVVANIYTGEIAPETARYADADEAGQVLAELVRQGRLEGGSYEVRPAPAEGETAPALTPTGEVSAEQQR